MTRRELIEEKLTGSVIGAFYEVYGNLGFGHLEHIYKAALERELLARGHQVGREVSVVVMYKGEALATERLDLLVDGRVVVEVKSTAEVHPSAQRQLYSYLRATYLEVGLLLHFGLQPKFHRVVELHKRPAPMRELETDSPDSAESPDRASDSATPRARNEERG